MQFKRRFTTSGDNPFAALEFRFAASEIRNPDGTVVFQAENVEVPVQFSQVATDIMAQKYPQGRHPRETETRRGKLGAVLAVAFGPR